MMLSFQSGNEEKEEDLGGGGGKIRKGKRKSRRKSRRERRSQEKPTVSTKQVLQRKQRWGKWLELKGAEKGKWFESEGESREGVNGWSQRAILIFPS